MSIENIIAQLAVLEAEIEGTKQAYGETPESLTQFPCFINYPLRGTLHFSAAEQAQSDHTIVCELHVVRGILPQAENLVRPFIKRFRDKMAANLSLNGTVTTIKEIRYEYVEFIFAKEKHLGIRFEMDVEEKEAITVGL